VGFLTTVKSALSGLARGTGAKSAANSAWHGENGPFRAHHPVFSHFEPFVGKVPVHLDVDYIGACTRPEFLPQPPQRSTLDIRCELPPVDEEYFEWIDLLSSVRDARTSYTMVELGAGFGRWAVRAALAARRAGIERIRLGVVEPEPKHAQWLRQHLADNGVGEHEVKVYEASASAESGEAVLSVGPADEFGSETARTWYGQFVLTSPPPAWKQASAQRESYCGRPMTPRLAGETVWSTITVPALGIREVLADFDVIDLLDVDVQGAELEILRAGIELMDERVRRVHIGTHGEEIERGLRRLFRRHGWISVFDYKCRTAALTPFGQVWFDDGVQSWLNPRLGVPVG
jgi:FkbM family methyltransferase